MIGRFRRLLAAVARDARPYHAARWGQRALPKRGGRGAIALPCVLSVAFGLSAMAAEVHVVEQEVYGGVTNVVADTVHDTSGTYLTATPSAHTGYIFAEWTTTDANGFTPRDVFGRAHENAPHQPFQNITLTANYLPESQDNDHDGIPDGWEIYWYGNLSQNPASDTDGDGYTFAQEIAAGTSPLMPDRPINGGVVWLDSSEWLYNPSNYPIATIRSEPEGALFETVVEVCAPGNVIDTSVVCVPSVSSSAFAYWALNGVRRADAFGRAVDSLVFTMPAHNVEVVAVTAEDEMERLKLYWYGRADISVLSDTDGDGCTFAEEIAAGTSPVMPDRTLKHGVVWLDSDEWLYNPNRYSAYTICSEPEGVLFETETGIAAPGTSITTPAVSQDDGFAYWTLNGARMADDFGRALDSATVTAAGEDITLVAHVVSNDVDHAKMYWYGSLDVAMDSDTDHDGYTFAEELAAGTSPVMPDRAINGGVVWLDSEETEMNLQPYEQVQGAIVDDQFKHFFTSPIAGNEVRSETFGEDLQPIVWDLNGDGLFDLVLVYKGGYNTFINVGYHGNPEFEERRDVPTNGVDLAMNDLTKLGALELDVQPVEALSATTNCAALLVSDVAGRIWYYQRRVADNAPYQLQHKVWGGSHAGFAEGLRLAAVDWDEDGDLDCLAGTAVGKLMLLRDPKVGRPTNLKALAGVDTVVLTWDPNQQSRIRGYRLYRANGESEDFAHIAEPQLPTYRDTPPATATYGYKVSSVSRFYTAGNSTPTITESPATEAVRATLGGVKFNWRDVNTKVGERVEVVIAIENALNYDVAGKTQSLTYDPEYLRPIEVVKSGITENIEMTDSAQNGNWTVTMSSGVLPAGSGRFLTFVFDTLKEGTTTAGGATLTISAASRYFLGDVNGDGVLTKADAQLLARLKNGARQHPTSDQIKAGDFNGNGKLDNADYQALRALLKDMGVL